MGLKSEAFVAGMAETLGKLRVEAATEKFVVRDGLVCRPKGKYPYAAKVWGAEEVEALALEAYKFWLTEGAQTTAFEKGLSQHMSGAPVVACNSGSSANLLAVAAIMQDDVLHALHPGDHVVTTGLGFPTTLAPLIQLGLDPVLVDVSLRTWNVNCDELKKAVRSRHAKAVILAHTLGNPFNAPQVYEALPSNVFLIEDCCDALGSTLNSVVCGTFGTLSTLSFYPPHHITCGEGGAVVCNGDGLAVPVRSLRDWGRDCTCRSGENNRCGQRFIGAFGTLPANYDHKFVYSRPGYNLKTTDLQTAVGNVQLNRLPEFVQARKRNWSVLADQVSPLVQDGLLEYQLPETGSDPSWFGFGVRLTGCSHTRSVVVKALADAGIDTRHPFAGNLARQPGFADHIPSNDVQLPNTDILCENAFFLGCYPGLSEDDCFHIARVLTDVVRCW